jgi:hypothetical protein
LVRSGRRRDCDSTIRKGSPPRWAPFLELRSCGLLAERLGQTVAGTPWKKARSPTEFDVNLTRSARLSLTHEAATGVAAWAWSRVSHRLIDRHFLSPRSARADLSFVSYQLVVGRHQIFAESFDLLAKAVRSGTLPAGGWGDPPLNVREEIQRRRSIFYRP